jgi:GNAT superfamily N-acetyltransferase
LKPEDLNAALGLAAAVGARALEPASLTRALNRRDNPGHYCLLAVESATNEIIGILTARPDSPGALHASRVNVAVDFGAQLLGVDRWLLGAFETFARGHDITSLRTRVRGGDRALLSFYTSNGFKVDHRMCYLVLEVAEARAGPPPAEAVPAEEGIAILSFTHGAIDEGLLTALAQVMDGSAEDWPPYYDDEPASGVTTPARMKGLLEGSEDGSVCLLAAFAGDDLVGFTNFHEVRDDKSGLQQGITAVKHAHSGHGIGQALKAGVLNFAIQHGYRTIETHNRADNAAMLHINEKFGFRCISDELRLYKPL